MAVLKSRLQMYGGAMFVLDIKTRYKAPNEHIFNKGAIKRAELLDAWHRFMDTPGDQGGFDPARMLSDEDLVVRKAAPGSRVRDTPRSSARCCCHCSHSALPEHVELLRFHAAGLYLDTWKQWIVPGEMARAEAQASRAAAGVIDTLTTVLDSSVRNCCYSVRRSVAAASCKRATRAPISWDRWRIRSSSRRTVARCWALSAAASPAAVGAPPRHLGSASMVLRDVHHTHDYSA